VPGLISYKEMPAAWRREETPAMDKNLKNEIEIEAFTKEGPNECTY
jgi:hypothetical protein